MFISAIGISHKTAPLEERERLAFSASELPSALNFVREKVGAGVMLRTCNRAEPYLTPEENDGAAQGLADPLAPATGASACREPPPVHVRRCERPARRELELNPLRLGEQGAVAVDARLVLERCAPALERYGHMAIHPYPSDLVERWERPDGYEVVIRPIRPEDAAIEERFVRELSGQSRYFRFMYALKELTPAMLSRFTQIDYDREMALVAVLEERGEEREIGVARYVVNPDGESCEFAVVVADAWQGKGIATRLMTSLMRTAASRRLAVIQGEVLSENHNMLRLLRGLGFQVRAVPDSPGVEQVWRRL